MRKPTDILILDRRKSLERPFKSHDSGAFFFVVGHTVTIAQNKKRVVQWERANHSPSTKNEGARAGQLTTVVLVAFTIGHVVDGSIHYTGVGSFIRELINLVGGLFKD